MSEGRKGVEQKQKGANAEPRHDALIEISTFFFYFLLEFGKCVVVSHLFLMVGDAVKN